MLSRSRPSRLHCSYRLRCLVGADTTLARDVSAASLLSNHYFRSLPNRHSGPLRSHSRPYITSSSLWQDAFQETSSDSSFVASSTPPQSRPEHLNHSSSQQPIPQYAGHGQQDHAGSEDGPCLEETMLAVQEAAVTDLEKDLGMSLEEAVQQENFEEQLLEVLANREPTEIESDPDTIIEGGGDPISALRNSGAPQEEVVREARQIFGESLPEGVLDESEYKIYCRLYGEPESKNAEDDGSRFLDELDDIDPDNAPQTALFNTEGVPVNYTLETQQQIEAKLGPSTSEGQPGSREAEEQEEDDDGAPEVAMGDIALPSPGGLMAGVLDNRFARARDVAKSLGADMEDNQAQDLDENEDYENSSEYEDEGSRVHPLTRLGKFGTYPSTTYLTKSEFVRPVERIMSKYSNKHLKKTCEQTFGGPGLPDSPLTPRSGRGRQQVPIPLNAGQHFMGEMEANAFLTTVMPPTYASIMSVLIETRKRLGQTWLNNLLSRPGGPRVLDAGSGGVGIIAWREVIRAHWDALHESDAEVSGSKQKSIPPEMPPSKNVVLTGSDTLRHRAAELLENTTFIPRLPDYVHVRDSPTLEDDRPAQQRKQFDIIIASHSLFGLKEDWEKKQHVQNLWSLLSNEGGILIMIEKGISRGFECIAGARELLLERHIASPAGQSTHYSVQELDGDPLYEKGTGMIVAPCTTHEKCPMYLTGGKSRGRRDICGFQQRYIRPPFLQRVLGAKDRNHDDVDFSYISVMKGDDLRLRRFKTWEQVDDPLSALVHPEPDASSLGDVVGQSTNENPSSKSWLRNLQYGFEDFVPTSSNQGENFSTTNATDGFGHPDGQTRPSLPSAHTLPRSVFPPLKRRGHVSLDLCTPAGKIERWTIPRSFSLQAYRDARKSKWGDLWALGAKTRVPRNLRTGASQKDIDADGDGKFKGALGKARGKKERLRMQAEQILQAQEAELDAEQRDHEEMMRLIDAEAEGAEDGEESFRPYVDDNGVVYEEIAEDEVQPRLQSQAKGNSKGKRGSDRDSSTHLEKNAASVLARHGKAEQTSDGFEGFESFDVGAEKEGLLDMDDLIPVNVKQQQTEKKRQEKQTARQKRRRDKEDSKRIDEYDDDASFAAWAAELEAGGVSTKRGKKERREDRPRRD